MKTREYTIKKFKYVSMGELFAIGNTVYMKTNGLEKKNAVLLSDECPGFLANIKDDEEIEIVDGYIQLLRG